MSIEEDHAQAGLALLTAALPGRVYDGKVPDPMPDPEQGWVLVRTRVAWPREGPGISLAEAKVGVTTTFTCYCVGATATATRNMSGLVRQALLNVRPSVTARSCGPIKEEPEGADPIFDETTGRLVVTETHIYTYLSVPT